MFCGQEVYSVVNSFWSVSDNLPSLIQTLDVLELILRSVDQRFIQTSVVWIVSDDQRSAKFY